MPGRSYRGALAAATPEQAEIRGHLREHVETLAGKIGERNPYRAAALDAAAQYLRSTLTQLGYEVHEQPYKVESYTARNLWIEIPGSSKPTEIVVVGAHYDSVFGTPGANDNGSGVAALLELARMFRGQQSPRTLRLVFFTLEEPPYFQTDSMGSMVYARSLRAQKVNVVAMLSLETIGYYSDAKGSQHYPAPLAARYPDTGNFIAFASNPASRELLTRVIAKFREAAKFPSEGGAVPESITGAGWSDQWSFWQVGYPGVMVTDTAIFRYPDYHQPSDTPDKVDYDRVARVVAGLKVVIADLATN